MGERVTVARLPNCDFCGQRGVTTEARYDFRTTFGAWAFGCERHWRKYRATAKLGTGNGQRLEVDAAEEMAATGATQRGF